jgi:hypothetical protein
VIERVSLDPWNEGPPERREPADDADRQYPVLRGGAPC